MREGLHDGILSTFSRRLDEINGRVYSLCLVTPEPAKASQCESLPAISSQKADGRHAFPFYVNLKEWRRQKSWTAEDKPTAEEFYKFLFYSDYWKILTTPRVHFFRTMKIIIGFLRQATFFFILNSFDEIPAVLDHDENSSAHW